MKFKWDLSTDNKVKLIVAVIGGTCAIIAAIVGGANLIGVLHISFTLPSQTTPSAGSNNAATPTQASGGGSSVINNPPPAPSPGVVLRQGTFTISQSYCINLDSSSANWGGSNSCATDSTPADIRQIGNVAVDAPNDNNSFSILSRSQDSTLSTCKAATDFVTSIYVSSLHKGKRFCVHTSSGNEALLQVKSVASDDTAVTFAAIVWKG